MEDEKAPAASAGSTFYYAVCGNGAAEARLRGRYQELHKLELGSQKVTFHVVVERGERDEPRTGPPPGVLWKGTLEFSVQVLPKLSDVLPGVHDATLDAAMRRALTPVLRGGALIVRADLVPEFKDTAVSLDLALLEGTDVRESDTLLVLDRPGGFVPTAGWQLPEDLHDRSNWSIRVRGRGKDALRAWNATRYWDGEIVIPLSEVPHW